MSVAPKAVGPVFCKAFNSTFGGRRYTPGHRLGTGQVYCKYTYRKSPILVVGTVFADKRSMGRAFCSLYHPAGWRRS
jgi:hypothetical protein